MPLVSTLLQSNLVKVMDKNAAGFVGFGGNAASVGSKWADAIAGYAGTNLIPVSTAAVAAKTALVTAISAGVTANTFKPSLISALTTYAAALGVGMSPAFTAVPPASPVSLTTFPATGTTTAAAVAAAWATAIDLWFRTGTATPSAGGAPIPWA